MELYSLLQQLRSQLSEADLAQPLSVLLSTYEPLPDGWQDSGEYITRTYKFANVATALEFMNSAIPILGSEGQSHYKNLEVTLTLQQSAKAQAQQIHQLTILPPASERVTLEPPSNVTPSLSTLSDKNVLDILSVPGQNDSGTLPVTTPRLGVHLSDSPAQTIQLDMGGMSDQVQIEAFDEPKQHLRVPIAAIGRWEREGQVIEFTAEKFEQIINNFQQNELGFAPPLFLGHQSNYIMVEGAPAVGFLTDLAVINNILYGTFEVVDETTYLAVKKGQYRHASAEVILDGAKSKRNGKEVGALLFGVALTNRPFIPDLPFVEALSTSILKNPQPAQALGCTDIGTSVLLEWNLDKAPSASNNMSGTSSMSEPAPVSLSAFEQRLNELTQLNTNLQQQHDLVVQQLAQTTSALTQASEKIQMLEQMAAMANEQLLQRSIQADVDFINSLTLSEDLRAKYIALAQQNQLGENKQLLFDTLKLHSEAAKAAALTQHGTASADNLTQPADDSEENGFQKALTDIIARNHELIKSRPQKVQPRSAYIL